MAQVLDAVAAAMRNELVGGATGHDSHHSWRVFALGWRLARGEGADPLVVGAAALTHDVHRVTGDGEYVRSRESLPRVESILRAAGVPDERIEEVLHCVAVHGADEFDDAAGDDAEDDDPAETLEALVVEDADNLDAI